MLPGGIRVLGVYVSDDQNSDKVLKSPIVESCIQKIDSILNGGKKTTNYVSMHFDKKNGTFACDVLSVVDGALTKGRKSTEVEEADSDFRWQVVTSKFLFDYPIVFKSGPEVQKQAVFINESLTHNFAPSKL
jgi:hypothetical protein